MDPYSNRSRAVEYYQYVEKQKEDFIDLSNQSNNSVYQFAKLLFGKPIHNLGSDLSGILFDETMEIADVFCMLVEVVLYGVNILSGGQNTIFDLTADATDTTISTLKSYLKSTGFNMDVREEISEDDDVILYRDKADYYCEIVPKPPAYMCSDPWCVLDYRMIGNRNFVVTPMVPLENFKLFFITRQKKIFVVNFSFT